ncbi:MAG TPA: hypothetical protein DEP48_01025 [Persephonella sp.]|uniref:GTP-binding signal recognition particle SRP54 G-domain protein n=1 Tax=Persephonella marina (strain DSM 14350 / EX-H1) TaxID=123214 RepID=C0QR74_PERMH|nr:MULTISPECIES: GTP-binding signal recognition particle SRP54 G- domain protein [Persephonella]ACO04709.1 GTP-binding signal recognition particle SRP54 G- domain protein [Persephonella marina EX-H1]HCB68917.1 hypothetical protein [Persephonella sp.]
MKMKIFQVDNLQEGWVKIREDLGDNAIILSIKEIDGRFEILAASPEKKETKLKKNIHKIDHKFNPLSRLLSILDKGLIPGKLEESLLDEIKGIYLKIAENIEGIDIQEKIEKDPFKKKYITVLGNISSGKSTTVAKIGAILKFNKNRKIAIASFDFYKIGGSESLKKFCEIMQIPFFLIKNEKDLILYKDAFEEFDHILFDTPGNIKQLPEVEKIVSFITNSSQSENILTVPLTRKENIVEKDINYFSKFNIDHLILTKYDEIQNSIPLIFIILNWNYKISYITDGMDVPKDIKEASEILTQLVEVYR